MKQWQRLIPVCALAAMAATMPSRPVAAVRGAALQVDGETIETRIDRLFAAVIQPDAPGCSVGVSRGQATVLERGYGMASLEAGAPITPASVFHVGSISKPITAMSTLLLAQDGKLSIQDEVRRHVPGWSVRQPVTIAQLLSHTAGLRNAFLLIELAAPHDGSVPRTDQFVALLARQRGLVFDPGSRFEYNNGGYVLLADIVRRVSGQSLAAFAETRIFQPLGMAHSHVHDDPSRIVPHLATGYTRAGGGFALARAPDGVVGNAGLFTTAGDLLRWARNMATPRVGDAALFARMQTPATLTGGATSVYGFGLFVETIDGRRTVSHGGNDPGASAYLVRYPDDDLAVAVLCNEDSIDSIALARGVADLYLPARDAAPASTAAAPSAATTIDPTRLAAHAGLYRQPGEETLLRFVVRDGVLRGSAGAGSEDAGWPTAPLGGDRFAIPGTAITLEFGPGPGGGHRLRVVGEHPTPDVLERVGPFTPSPADLAAVAGAYTSDELDVAYTVRVREGTVGLRIPGRAEIALLPIRRDMFAGSLVGAITFARRPGPAVEGFTIHAHAARGVTFARVNGPHVAAQGVGR